MERKYKLTDECMQYVGHKLYRIQSLRSFSDVEEGELGGYIESEDNLSHDGMCWVYDEAKVFGNAKVYNNACVYLYAEVFGNAKICGNAEVSGDAEVFDNAKVCGNAEVFGNAKVCGNAEVYNKNDDYIVFKNWWSSGRYFTWTRSNNMWKVGCFYGTGEELIKKAYEDSELSGREYERVVKYVESIIADNN